MSWGSFSFRLLSGFLRRIIALYVFVIHNMALPNKEHTTPSLKQTASLKTANVVEHFVNFKDDFDVGGVFDDDGDGMDGINDMSNMTPEKYAKLEQRKADQDRTHDKKYAEKLKQFESKYEIIFQTKVDLSKNTNYLEIFHKDLQCHEKTIVERYGWSPSIGQRVAGDKKCAYIAYAIVKQSNIESISTKAKTEEKGNKIKTGQTESASNASQNSVNCDGDNELSKSKNGVSILKGLFHVDKHGMTTADKSKNKNDSEKEHKSEESKEDRKEIAAILTLIELNDKDLKVIEEEYSKQFNEKSNLENIEDCLFSRDRKTSFDIGKNFKHHYEVAAIVLPKFQRQHIATQLMRQTWNKFGNNDTRWYSMVNSNKSKQFNTSIYKWFPFMNYHSAYVFNSVLN